MKPFFLVTFLMLYGCATFHAEPLSASKAAAEFEARTLESPGLKKFIESHLHRAASPWPPAAWDFRMLTLAASYYSPALDVMRARWGVAQAAVITAGGRPNPSISSFGQHHSSTPGGISPWTWGISLDIPVETAGKRGYRIRKAEQLSEAARLDISEAAWGVWSSLKKSLLDLYMVTGKERYLLDQLSVDQRIAKLFEERLAAGEASQFEVTQSRLVLDKTRLLLSDNEKKKAEARNAVAGALGLRVKALKSVQISFDLFAQTPGPVDVQDIRRKALLGRSDILAALQEYEASQSALQLEIAKQYPDIHLGPAYEWDQGDNRWALGFSIELPVFNQNQGPIEEARARRKEAAGRFAALQARVIGQIDRAEATYVESLRNLRVADSLLSAGESLMSATMARFKEGEAGRLDLEQAKMELSAAELSRFEVFITAQADFARLEDAVQIPLNARESFPETTTSYFQSETVNGGGAKK
jgi:cobalt-zinc-cadmium efflux system outer membrane protein